MAKKDVQYRFQHIVGPICAICLLAYFIYHIIQGERGILSWMRFQQKITESQQQLETVQAEHDSLERRVYLMRPDSLDPDMLEERARQVLNFARKDEVVIADNDFIPPEKDTPPPSPHVQSDSMKGNHP